MNECCQNWRANARETWILSRVWSPLFGTGLHSWQHTPKVTSALLRKLKMKVMDWPRTMVSPVSRLKLTWAEHMWGILKAYNNHLIHDVIVERWKRIPVQLCGGKQYWQFGHNLDMVTVTCPHFCLDANGCYFLKTNTAVNTNPSSTLTTLTSCIKV